MLKPKRSFPATPAMRRAPLSLAVLAGLGLFASAAQAGATLDRVTKTGVVTDILVDDYPPFSFIGDDNRLAGFDVDVAQAFADKLGAKLKLETPGWESIIGGRWNGRWDVCIGSTTPSTERAQVLDFPVVYYDSPAVLVVHKDSKIASAGELTGKRVGVGSGSSYEAYLAKTLTIPDAPTPITYPFGAVTAVPGDETVAFQNLALGNGVRLDAVVADLATTKARIDKGAPLRIVSELYAEPNVVTTAKGDPEWNAKVKATILQLKADGTLATLSRKWFGQDITADAH